MDKTKWKIRPEFIELVEKEIDSQLEKYPGGTHHDVFEWLALVVEEVGECAKAIWKQDWENLVEEMVQVMALCFVWLEDMTA